MTSSLKYWGVARTTIGNKPYQVRPSKGEPRGGCKDICSHLPVTEAISRYNYAYRGKHASIGSNEDEKWKYCRSCEYYLVTDTWYCPCCRYKMSRIK